MQRHACAHTSYSGLWNITCRATPSLGLTTGTSTCGRLGVSVASSKTLTRARFWVFCLWMVSVSFPVEGGACSRYVTVATRQSNILARTGIRVRACEAPCLVLWSLVCHLDGVPGQGTFALSRHTHPRAHAHENARAHAHPQKERVPTHSESHTLRRPMCALARCRKDILEGT